MKKNVSRLLQPNLIWYYILMLLFSAATAAVGYIYLRLNEPLIAILAGAELLITILVFIISRARFSRRKLALMQYVQSATDAVGISVHAGSPFPMAVLHLPESEIIWGNPSFYAVTGLADSTRYQTMEAVVPGFTTDWLREGRTEFPGDQLINGRRYRIYGNYVRSDDDQTTVMLATVYFADMTEMFNIRDEYLRTRPIVSVILIDNYDEMTNNLSDSAISNLDAQINETVTHWIEGCHGICRKLERNRYLLIFENKDFQKLQEGKFSILTTSAPSSVPAALPRQSRSASARTARRLRRTTTSPCSPLRWRFRAAAIRPSSRTATTSRSTADAPRRPSAIPRSRPAWWQARCPS